MTQQVKKKIGLWTLVSLGVGSIIGSGIFALPAAMGAVAGPGLILAILLAGLMAIFLALPYAELGAAFPLEGGPYAFPRLSMGTLTGFLMGWGFFLYLFIGTAGIINIFVLYTGFYVPGLVEGSTLTPLGISVAVIFLWIFTIINIYGVEWGGLYSVITTIGKLIPMVIFALAGFMFFQGDNFVPFMPFGFTGVTLAVTLFFWSYTGFEAIVVPTGEVKNPSKNIPLAMILTLLITIVAYMLIAVAFVGMINWDGVHLSFKSWKEMTLLSSPLSDVSKALGLMWLAVVVSIGAIIGTGGSGGGWVLIQGRMPYAMAKDRLFWNSMARVHPKYGTPVNSLLFSSFLTTIILIAIPNFPSVALVATVTVLVPYAAAIISVPILRKLQPKTPRPFKLPCVMTFSIIGFILATYLFYWGSWPWTLVGGLLVLTGYPAFLFVKEKEADWKKSLWVPAYILGIVIVSFLGDPKFMFNNFLPWSPLGYLTMPYDLVILGIFAIIIFAWAYKENIKVRE